MRLSVPAQVLISLVIAIPAAGPLVKTDESHVDVAELVEISGAPGGPAPHTE